MGLAFYLKYTLGFIPSAEKLENKYNKLVEKKETLEAAATSVAVKNYIELNSIVGHIDKKEAKKIQNTTYNGETETEKLAVQRQLKEFETVKEAPEVKSFLSLKPDKTLNFFKEWDQAFNSNFESGEGLLKSTWVSGDPAAPLDKGAFSQNEEKQCFNGFENIELNGKGAKLHVKKEKKEGLSWDGRFGFLPKTFNYTSAHINSADSYKLNTGYIEVKMKFKPQKGLTNVLSLKAEKPFPIVDLIRSTDKGVGFGVIQSENKSDYTTLNSINFNKYHIFRLEITKSTLTWKINDEPVHTVKNTLPKSDFALNWLSTVHEELTNNSAFEIDYIRAFTPNK